MSHKMECPGCNSYTSEIADAFEEGEPCPTCHLSHAAAEEILTVQQSRADAELRAKYETAVKECDQAQRELVWANKRLTHLKYELGSLLGRIDQPLSAERGDW